MSQTFIPETGVGKLQVEDKFKSLVAVATGVDSPYIKAKESMLEYFKDSSNNSTLSEREKADTLSKLVGDMAISITNHMMDTAVKITTEDRDAPYMLAKVVADVEQVKTATDKIEKDTKLQLAQIDKINQDIEAEKLDMYYKQAMAYSKTGMALLPSGVAGAIHSYHQNAAATDIVSGKASTASAYTGLASSFRKDGVVSGTGFDVVMQEGNESVNSLSKAQTRVAVRQEQGFDDNMLQHATNSSANLMGLMISSENANLLGDSPTGIIPETYLRALSKLESQASAGSTSGTSA